MSTLRLADHLRSLLPPWVVLAPAATVHALATAAGARVGRREVDGRACTTKAELLGTLARSLALPTHFGHNWDALADCLRDLELRADRAFALVFTHGDHVLAAELAERETLVSVLALAGEHWAAAGRPFHSVVSRSAGAPAGPTAWRVPAIDG
jgi:hypothetical protein